MKNRSVATAITVIAVVLMAGVGIGFAASSSLNLNDNSLSAKAYSIDVGGSVSGLVVPEPYHTGATIPPNETETLSGYSLNIDWNDESKTVRAWLFLDAGAWLYVSSVSITIYDTNGENGATYQFQNGGQSGCATDAISGLSDGSHPFTLTFSYKAGDVPYLTYDSGTSIWSNGCKLTFAAGSDDPLS